MKRALVLLATLLIPWAAQATCSDCAASTLYVPVTIDATKVPEAIPFISIHLEDMPIEFHDAMDDASDVDGKTIRVTDYIGVTEYASFTLGMNTTTDQGLLFFEAGGLSTSVDTTYRVYVGNPAATLYATTDTYGQYNVFPASIVAFYTLSGATPLNNAAQNAYHLTASGTPTYSGNGPTTDVGSYLFSGSAQYLYSASTPTTDWPVSISAWFNSDSITLSQTIAAMANNGAADNYAVLEAAGSVASDPIRWRSYGDGGSERIATTGAVGYSADTWTFASGDYDGGAGHARISGANTGTQNNDPISADFNYISIAVARRSSLTNYFDGEISQVQFNNVGHTANYDLTMFNMMSPTITFYSVGTYVPIGGGSGSTGSFFF